MKEYASIYKEHKAVLIKYRMSWAIIVTLTPILAKQEEVPTTTNSKISKMKEYIYKEHKVVLIKWRMPWAITVTLTPILTKQEEVPTTTNSKIAKMMEYIYKELGSKPVVN